MLTISAVSYACRCPVQLRTKYDSRLRVNDEGGHVNDHWLETVERYHKSPIECVSALNQSAVSEISWCEPRQDFHLLWMARFAGCGAHMRWVADAWTTAPDAGDDFEASISARLEHPPSIAYQGEKTCARE